MADEPNSVRMLLAVVAEPMRLTAPAFARIADLSYSLDHARTDVVFQPLARQQIGRSATIQSKDRTAAMHGGQRHANRIDIGLPFSRVQAETACVDFLDRAQDFGLKLGQRSLSVRASMPRRIASRS